MLIRNLLSPTRRLVRRLIGPIEISTHMPSGFERHCAEAPTLGVVRDLVSDSDACAGVEPERKRLLDDPAILDAVKRDEVPIPAPEDAEGYSTHALTYWLSGAADLRAIESMVPASSFKTVLDFGGATGRLARHIALHHPDSLTTIADLNLRNVDWVDNHFGSSVRGVKVSPYPHFPLADDSITLCVALSVFTHIDAYESGWLAEINRVLAPGGHAVLTVHSEDCWGNLSSRPNLLKTLSRNPSFVATYVATRMPAQRMVFDFSNSIEYNCNVFVSSDYVRSRWSKWFEVIDIRFRAHLGFQTAVVLRKR
ncbi:MAG TPA: methyltransferase domain-containing protein [Myxococcota bacterium]